MTATRFHFLERISLRDRTALKAFLSSVFKKEKQQAESIDVIFCSDEYLLQINKSHLQHNYYTDIITFNLAPADEPVIGELYISIDRIKENAASYGVPVGKELHRVIFHGVLHLCGYKDKTTKEVKQIRGKEDYYLTKYF